MRLASTLNEIASKFIPNFSKASVECSGHYDPLCESCNDCLVDYDPGHFPNNYDCGCFKPYNK